MKKLYFIVPCYNEEEILDSSAYKMKNKLEELEGQKKLVDAASKIVLVDDGSKDSTWIVMGMGGIVFGSSILMVIYNLAAYAGGKTIDGWASLSVSLWALSGIQLLALGLIGEYIGKVYIEVKHRPRYIIENIIGDADLK